jgi:aspartyl-tRNA(Asn)/glutamyl-tRNA(Gln) amidotransferase subunit A
MIAYASSLDQGGVLARSAEDCALLLQAMVGFDPRDSTSLQLPDEDFVGACRAPASGAATESAPLAGLRVGVPQEFFGEGLAADVRQAVEAGIAALCALGAVAVPVSLPRTALSIPAYYVIAPAEASSNLSRFDGVRYGHRAGDYADLRDMYMRTRAEGFGTEVKRRIMVGSYVLSHGYYDAYYVKAQQLRRLIADDFVRVFGEVDVIAGPVSPTTAWRIGEQTDDPVRNYLADIFTLPASLAGLPAMSLPCGLGDGRLPVGLQLIAPYLQEARLFATAGALQRATAWHLERPPAQGATP